jgi:hypothetical protein
MVVIAGTGGALFASASGGEIVLTSFRPRWGGVADSAGDMIMGFEICIDWLYGCPSDPGADEVRAKAAARRVFDRAGISGYAAQLSYQDQGGLFGDEAKMKGDALVWLAARAAANKAAVLHRADPGSAGVSIECRPLARLRAAG